jgi:signal peptidase I
VTGPFTEETPSDLPVEGPTEPAEPAEPAEPKRKHLLPFWVELPLLIIAALVVAVVIKTFLIQAFWIPSSSMENTLQLNDRVLVNKLAYQFADLERGDVVVFDDPRLDDPPVESLLQSIRRNVGEAIGLDVPRSEFIKRVIALPGQEIEIKENQLYVDGEVVDEPYLKPGIPPMADFGPLVVPTGHMFVMGDNRHESHDSRKFGPVPIDTIVGKAFVIMWPADRWQSL